MHQWAPRDESYRADEPITSVKDDLLGRVPFAHRVAEVIASRDATAGLVVGIYGKWGDGKTSVLNLLAARLRSNHPEAIAISFNPWHFSSVETLVRGLFDTLAEGLGKALPTDAERLGKALRRYGDVLASLEPRLGLLAAIGRAVSTVTIETLRDRVCAILRESNLRPVVLIDDIDRLDRRDTRMLLKLVRLSADFPKTTYVLAFDDEVVGRSLAAHYGDTDDEAGHRFLEKIVQVPLHLPAADAYALRMLTLSGVEDALRHASIELTEEESREFSRRFDGGLAPSLTTPRQSKRYVNALTFALPLLKGEVHAGDQMLVEGLRVFHPRLYRSIRENPTVYLARPSNALRSLTEERKKEIREVIGNTLRESGTNEQNAAMDMLKSLFPQLHAVYSRFSHAREFWDEASRQRRVCALDYFDRYFQYAIPAQDVSDQIVLQIERAALKGDAGASALFEEAAARDGGARLVHKLYLRRDVLSLEVARALTDLVATNGSAFAEDADGFLSQSPQQRAAVLVAALIARFPDEAERDSLADHVVRTAKPLTLAFRCLRRLQKDDREPVGTVSAETQAELEHLLAERIKEASARLSLLSEFPKSAMVLLWAWKEYGDSAALGDYLARCFAKSPAEALTFLGGFSGRVISADHPPRPGDLSSENYEQMGAYVSQVVVADALTSHFGEGLAMAPYTQDPKLDNQERLARQFLSLHRERLSASGTGDGTSNP